MSQEDVTVLYRYVTGARDDGILFRPGLELITSRVVHQDQHYYYAVIDYGETHSKEIRVSKRARNRLAWPTKIEAYNSYIARAHASIARAEKAIQRARWGLENLDSANMALMREHPDLRLCACGRLVEHFYRICEECGRMGCDYCIRDESEHKIILAKDGYPEGGGGISFCYPTCQDYEGKERR
jgi:hypothetical protein